jgi:hypothetical protein
MFIGGWSIYFFGGFSVKGFHRLFTGYPQYFHRVLQKTGFSILTKPVKKRIKRATSDGRSAHEHRNPRSGLEKGLQNLYSAA